MACRLFGAKALSKPTVVFYQLDSWQQISGNFESELYRFIQENAFGNIVHQISGHFVQEEMNWINIGVADHNLVPTKLQTYARTIDNSCNQHPSW